MAYKIVRTMTDPVPALAKLEEFSGLESGWHFGEGSPSSPRLTKAAKVLVEFAVMSSLAVDVFPGIDGEIMVCIYHDPDYLEMTLELDESVTYVHERSDIEIEYSEALRLGDILLKLKTFQDESCQNTSEGSIYNTTIPQKKNSRALHSNHQRTVEFLASTLIAYMAPLIISADTSEDFTRHQMTGTTNTQSSGSSRWMNCLQAA